MYVTQAATTQPSFNLTALVTYSTAVSQGPQDHPAAHDRLLSERLPVDRDASLRRALPGVLLGPGRRHERGNHPGEPGRPDRPMEGLDATSLGLELAELAASADIEQTTTLTAGAKTTTATKTGGA